jgi:hypothetical protein
MNSYHIDQLGRVVKQVPEVQTCKGCLYHSVVQANGVIRRCYYGAMPLENRPRGGALLCIANRTIFVEVTHE